MMVNVIVDFDALLLM